VYDNEFAFNVSLQLGPGEQTKGRREARMGRDVIFN
jgi:hypothetical protein